MCPTGGAGIAGICALCGSNTWTVSPKVWCSQWTCEHDPWRKVIWMQNLPLSLLFQVPVPPLCVCRSTRMCLCFLCLYRTECSEWSCYCMCLLSHMEAVRLQECFGSIMPGTDNLSSSSSLLLQCCCCHTHLVPWNYLHPLPEKLVFPHRNLRSPQGKKALGSAVWGPLQL